MEKSRLDCLIALWQCSKVGHWVGQMKVVPFNCSLDSFQSLEVVVNRWKFNFVLAQWPGGQVASLFQPNPKTRTEH